MTIKYQNVQELVEGVIADVKESGNNYSDTEVLKAALDCLCDGEYLADSVVDDQTIVDQAYITIENMLKENTND